MKIKWLVYFLFVSGATATMGLPIMGPSTGGGGFVVSCPKTPVSPAMVELLDLYEGRRKSRFQMVEASGDLVRDYFSSVDRTYTRQGHPHLAEELRAEVIENLVTFMQSTVFVETSNELPHAEDLGEAKVPSQCQIQQVAYYEDGASTIYILRPLWEQLSSRDQAALVQHELWYRSFRDVGEAQSVNARHAVAIAFAESGPISIEEGVPPRTPEFSSYDWKSKKNEISSFYAINYTTGRTTRLQFTQVAGVGMLSKTWSDFPLLQWNFKLGRSSEDPEVVGCILTTPDVDQEYQSPIKGGLAGYTVVMKMKTGEPVSLFYYHGNRLLSKGTVRGGTNCSAQL